jgi:hypothetical protein
MEFGVGVVGTSGAGGVMTVAGTVTVVVGSLGEIVRFFVVTAAEAVVAAFASSLVPAAALVEEAVFVERSEPRVAGFFRADGP